MMNLNNRTTCKIIGMLCLAICGVFSLYRFASSPTIHSHTGNEVVLPIQAQYTAQKPPATKYQLASDSLDITSLIDKHEKGITALLVGIIVASVTLCYLHYRKQSQTPQLRKHDGTDYTLQATDDNEASPNSGAVDPFGQEDQLNTHQPSETDNKMALLNELDNEENQLNETDPQKDNTSEQSQPQNKNGDKTPDIKNKDNDKASTSSKKTNDNTPLSLVDLPDPPNNSSNQDKELKLLQDRLELLTSNDDDNSGDEDNNKDNKQKKKISKNKNHPASGASNDNKNNPSLQNSNKKVDSAQKQQLKKILITEVERMLLTEGTTFPASITFNTSSIKNLNDNNKKLILEMQMAWGKFSTQMQKTAKTITIDIGKMYDDYRSFAEIFFVDGVYNLLLFDKITRIFPNANTIICENTDLTSHIDNKFIGKLLGILPNIQKSKPLHTIIIETSQPIKDDVGVNKGTNKKLDLQIKNFAKKGWHIKKASKQIMLTDKTKASSINNNEPASGAINAKKIPQQNNNKDNNNKDNLNSKQGVYIPQRNNEIVTDTVENIIKKQLLPHIRGINEKSISITIDMSRISSDDKWVSTEIKNLLQFNEIEKKYNQVTEIICINTDYIGQNNNQAMYSSGVISPLFIAKLSFLLSQLPLKKYQLQKIIIKTKSAITLNVADKKLFNSTTWNIQKTTDNKQITLTKQKAPDTSIMGAVLRWTGLI